MKKLTTLLFSALFFLTAGINNLKAQCHNYPQSFYDLQVFYDLIDETPVIIEGQATGEFRSFRGNNSIYTAYAVKVFKVLKGDFDACEVEVIHHGGGVDGRYLAAPISTDAFGGETGIYMLYPVPFESPTEVPQELKFWFYSPCFFISYDKWVAKFESETATHGWTENAYGLNSEEDVKEKIYKPIRKKVGYKYREMQPLEKKNGGLKTPSAKGGAGYAKSNDTIPIPQISGFYPDTLTAGTFDTLTIEGCNFDTVYTGNIRVAFLNA